MIFDLYKLWAWVNVYKHRRFVIEFAPDFYSGEERWWIKACELGYYKRGCGPTFGAALQELCEQL